MTVGKYVSMRGVPVDVEAILSNNQETVAITGRSSTIRMNARGDALDRNGKVKYTREELETNYNTEIEGNVHKPETIQPDVFITPAEAIRLATEAKKAAQAEKATSAEQPEGIVKKPSPVRTPVKPRTLVEDDEE